MHDDEIATLGRTLRRIDGRLLRRAPTDDARRIWFQGDEPYFDVTIEVDEDGEVRWLEITLRGSSLTLDVARGELKTGITNEREVSESAFPSSKTIAPDRDPRVVFVDRMVRLLEHGGDAALHAAAHAIRAQSDRR